MINVLYHANCPDGFWSAYAAWKRFGSEARYIPVNYNAPLPEIAPGEPVYILDFSYSRKILETLAKTNPIQVLDHHKSAKEQLEGLWYCHFDMSKSGAVLSWEYFHSELSVPELLLYVQDRDLWQWKLPKSKEVNAALYLHKGTNFIIADKLIEHPIEFFIQTGEIVLATQEVMVESILEKSFFSIIGKYTVPTVNSPILQSELGEALCIKYPKAPFVAIFSYPKNHSQCNWSLRSKNGFDCAEFAKEYGGGGHPGAAGFTEEV